VSLAATLLETATGLFFTLSGGNKLLNPGRHATFVATLADDLPRIHLGPLLPLLARTLPAAELAAGLAALAGVAITAAGYPAPFFSTLALMVMVGILLCALACEGAERIRGYNPINRGDAIADFFYLPETCLALMALAAILARNF
jgi:hypothetical protein